MKCSYLNTIIIYRVGYTFLADCWYLRENKKKPAAFLQGLFKSKNEKVQCALFKVVLKVADVIFFKSFK